MPRYELTYAQTAYERWSTKMNAEVEEAIDMLGGQVVGSGGGSDFGGGLGGENSILFDTVDVETAQAARLYVNRMLWGRDITVTDEAGAEIPNASVETVDRVMGDLEADTAAEIAKMIGEQP